MPMFDDRSAEEEMFGSKIEIADICCRYMELWASFVIPD